MSGRTFDELTSMPNKLKRTEDALRHEEEFSEGLQEDLDKIKEMSVLKFFYIRLKKNLRRIVGFCLSIHKYRIRLHKTQ